MKLMSLMLDRFCPRSSALALLAGIALVLLQPASVDAAALRKGPYLIYQDDPTQMSVLWQTDASPGIGVTLEWGLSTAYTLGSTAVLESGAGANEHQFWRTFTGLTPGLRYYYRVTVDGVATEHSFLAAPAAGATQLSFYAFGDTRSNPDYYADVALQVLADLDLAPDVQQTLLLHSGDWVAEGDIEADWDNQYFDRTRPSPLELMARLPVQGCRGNHERDGALLKKYFPYNYEVSAGGDSYFAFDYGPLHVTVIDQEEDFSNGSAQYSWIEQDLSQNAAPWKFVVLHKPPYSGGGGHGDHETTKAELVPLFETYDVDFVIAGHNHHYARAVVNDIQHVTTGGGGAGLVAVDLDHPFVVAGESVRHFSKLEIDGARLTFTAVRSDGSIIETFQIDKGPDLTPPRVLAVAAGRETTQVRLTFSEVVEAGAGNNSSENAANYSSPEFTVTAVALDASGRRADLTFSPPLRAGVTYSLTVRDLADRASPPNMMPSPQTVTFEYVPPPPEPEDLVAVGDLWRYLKGLSYPGDGWMDPSYDDTSWAEGPTGIGYGDGDDATLLDDMQDSYLTVYARRVFTVTDPARVSTLKLTIDYDDGFVAFINGAEVARRGVDPGQDHQTGATSHEADAVETIDLDAAIGQLVAGDNLLAIEVHNTSLGSSDLSLIPLLQAIVEPPGEPDAGVTPDASPTTDAASAVDVATVDVATVTDAVIVGDAAVNNDVAANGDAATIADAALVLDAATASDTTTQPDDVQEVPVGVGDGCACASHAPGQPAATWTAVAFALLARLRRRRSQGS